MQLHGQGAGAHFSSSKMKSYMAEVEQIDATRKQKAIAASQRKTPL